MRRTKSTDFGELQNALAAIVPGIEDVTTLQVGSFLSTMLVHSKLGDRAPNFDLGSESDGTIRSLALLTALYHSSVSRYIAIEEPELAIHPGAVRVLAQVILEISKRQQVIVTTHDPDMLDYFPVESIRVVRIEGLSTTVDPVTSSQKRAVRESLITAGELLRSGALRGSTDKGILSF
jgi:predicted ATPase